MPKYVAMSLAAARRAYLDGRAVALFPAVGEGPTSIVQHIGAVHGRSARRRAVRHFHWVVRDESAVRFLTER